ncbi:hypothetical protein ACGFZS_09600 [Streptomyces sp. NPDC048288]|uniref:hypothetical protein n=1 Tax=Streptomyces sp. NPDC048288 TaxID=3365529 RepID=UPI00371F752D
MRRLEQGAPLRAAMKAAGLDIGRLAAKTKEADPDRTGLSRALVGFIVGTGKTAREDCSDHAAGLIAAALDKPVKDLFEGQPLFFDEGSTSTRRSQIKPRRTALPEQLMDQRELARFLRKSPSWIDKQITAAKERDELWPGLIYVGHSRRFNPHEVLAGMQQSA